MGRTTVNITPFLRSIQRDYLPRLAVELAAGMNDFGNFVIADAKRRAPRGKTGELADSAFIDTATPGNLHVTIGFSSPHAIFVHENLNAHHDDGEAKFLENAMVTYGPQFPTFMAQRLRRGS